MNVKIAIGARPGVLSPPHAARLSARGRLIIWGLMLIGALVLLHAIFGNSGFLQLYRTRLTHQGLLLEVESLAATNAALEREIEALRSDPMTIETLAREQLGLIAPGDRVLVAALPAGANTRR
ncbi:MAG TPA: septum formation initiator family protein [Acidobacteriota bacterium]